jgi:hypothetical protein
MNGGDDDDFFFFFFNNNNRHRQRQLQRMTTSTTRTVAKRFQCRRYTKSYTTKQSLQVHIAAVHFGIRHTRSRRRRTFGSTYLALPAPESRFSAIDVESALRSVIGWPEHKVWHIEVDLDRHFKWFDLYAYRASTAATTLRRRPMFALTFSPITSDSSHSQSQ